jgi:predicted site-specific integrase-resolvase
MEKPQIPVAILVRVSTAKQETARQISELRQYADGKGYEVLEVCEETVSGSAQEDQRHGLISMIVTLFAVAFVGKKRKCSFEHESIGKTAIRAVNTKHKGAMHDYF